MTDTELIPAITAYSRGWKSAAKSKDATPFVTGNYDVDAFLHYMETQHGIRVVLKNSARHVERTEIVDEAKAAWFMLKHARSVHL